MNSLIHGVYYLLHRTSVYYGLLKSFAQVRPSFEQAVQSYEQGFAQTFDMVSIIFLTIWDILG
jgi:hypothetical protein